LPLITGANEGVFEFRDSSLLLFEAEGGQQVVSLAYWPEKKDFQVFFEETEEGAELLKDVVRVCNVNPPPRWRGLIPMDAQLLAGVPRPYLASYGLSEFDAAAFPEHAATLLGQQLKPWQVELYLPRVSEPEYAGIAVVTLPDADSWQQYGQDVMGLMSDVSAGAIFMGRLGTQQLEDLDHQSYTRHFSQTDRGVRLNTIAA
jgi:hypothetical protein